MVSSTYYCCTLHYQSFLFQSCHPSLRGTTHFLPPEVCSSRACCGQEAAEGVTWQQSTANLRHHSPAKALFLLDACFTWASVLCPAAGPPPSFKLLFCPPAHLLSPSPKILLLVMNSSVIALTHPAYSSYTQKNLTTIS